jgi:hypothetical protein
VDQGETEEEDRRMIWQVRPPEEVITNFDAVKEWAIIIGIGVAILVGVATLIGMGWAAFKRRKNG